MKSKSSSNLFALAAASAIAMSPAALIAATLTWDGGGGDANWSTDTNWVGDPASGPNNGDSLVFAGSANLNPNNDTITSLGSNAFNFAAGASSFNIANSSGAITVGNGASNDNFVTKVSTNDQTISANINLAGGGRDRTIVMTGGGSLTLSGNINFSNDWLFPTTSAGTIVLSGNNTGDGKASVLTSGTNTSRAMMRNNVAGTQLVLGSNTALGNSGSGTASAGTASFRGIVANQQLNISTTGGDRDLSGSSLMINANNITFNGTSNLTIGNIITQGGNRDFVVSSTGAVTVSNGIFLSHDQTGRQLFVNLSGAGGMVVNGVVADTFHSSVLTTAGSGTLRKAGTGMMTLNGNSSYTGATFIDAGTLKIGHANALGATGTSISTTTLNAATLDLNGYTIGETVNIANTGTLSNTSGTAAALAIDANVTSNFTVNATGDITATRLIGTGAIRTVTKLGNGTLTTNGTNHNNLISWDIQAGKVVLANTSGYGADRGVAINGGTLQLSGSNSNLINNNEAFTVNSGTFDLNGKSEATAAIAGSGGTIRNSLAASTSTLYVGGGDTSASYAGVIENGAGTVKLTKEGNGTQTLTGTNTYSGATLITAGTLALGSTGSIDATSGVSLGTAGTFDVSAKSGGYTVTALTGSGNIIGALTVSTTLAIGNSPGTATFNSDLTIGSSAISTFEFTDAAFTGGTFDLAQGGAGSQLVTFGGTLNLLFSGGSYMENSTVQIFNFESYSGSFGTVSFSGLDLGQSATFDSSTGYVTITTVPEPNAAMLVGGLGMLALLRRRRN